MTPAKAVAFVREHGVVLASAKGSIPRLTEAIVGEPIRGSWWAHPESRAIFQTLMAVADSDQILVCRLVQGRLTLVHRRLWPALVKLARRFPRERLAQVHEEHTASGRHAHRYVPFPEWVPADVAKAAKSITLDDAAAAFSKWLPRRA